MKRIAKRPPKTASTIHLLAMRARKDRQDSGRELTRS
jgi:hypothetical protein